MIQLKTLQIFIALKNSADSRSMEKSFGLHLSWGGSLQGALSSLEQKGLIYGSQLGHRVSLPLFDFRIKYS